MVVNNRFFSQIARKLRFSDSLKNSSIRICEYDRWDGKAPQPANSLTTRRSLQNGIVEMNLMRHVYIPCSLKLFPGFVVKLEYGRGLCTKQ